MRRLAPLLLAVLPCAGAVAADTYHLSETQAIWMAKEKLVREGVDVSKYALSSVAFNEKHEWLVDYVGKSRKPGDSYTVVVNDDSQAIRVVPGQ